jgi:serine protease inhibitor
MKRHGLGFFAILLVLAGCGADSETRTARQGQVLGSTIPRAPAPNADAAVLADGLNRFGFDLYATLAPQSDGDIVFSPLSMGIAFGMADAGARGETAAQIASVFRLPASGSELHSLFNSLTNELDRDRKATLELANRMYPAAGYDIEPDFVETLAAQYGAPLERLDFQADTEGARRRINAWVAERTKQRIPELFPAGTISPETVLALVNALYFEAKWLQPFGKYPTKKSDFTRLDGSIVKAPLMQNAELRTRFADAQGFQAVELPYEDGDLSMLVLVPDAGTFPVFERGLNAKRLELLDGALREGVVDLFLPRWQSKYNVDLIPPLQSLGLTLPFDGGDFTGISPTNPFIGAAVHAADIEVDEDGTVAAAATGIGFLESGPPTPDAVIRVDRPFLYLIRERGTGAVLFLGRVLDPAA